MLLDVPSSFKRPDGIWEHHIRQSDLERFNHCPELHRRTITGEVTETENDAALIGTVCHSIYRTATEELLEGTVYPLELLLEIGMELLVKSWNQAVDQDILNQVQIESIEQAKLYVARSIVLWHDEFYDKILKPNVNKIEAIEKSFDLLCYEDEDRRIFVTGTRDLDFDGEIYDYKHSMSAKYTSQKAWQLSRYGKQPTHYCLARLLGLARLLEKTEPGEWPTVSDEERFYFSFININPEKETFNLIGEPEGLKPRTIQDLDFHVKEMLNLALLIEAQLPAWPLGARDWWCSNVWCPAWKDCRGAFIGDDPWELMEKREIKLGLKLIKGSK